MIQVTERAAKKVIALAEKAGKPKVLRLGVKGGGCSGLSYFWDYAETVRDTDHHHDFFGLTVVCDPKSSPYLEDAIFDYEDKNLLKSGFKFFNPKAKRSCSCGESFSV